MRLLAPQAEGAAARRRSRDPQQDNVYDAESAAGCHHSWRFTSHEALAEWLQGCLQSGIIDEAYPFFRTYDGCQPGGPGAYKVRARKVVKFKKRPGRSIAHASAVELAFGPEGLCTWVALHELAHMIVLRRDGNMGYGHGWQFCEVYLWLVGAFIGRNEAQMMKDEFDKRGVHYSQEQAMPAWFNRRMGGRG